MTSKTGEGDRMNFRKVKALGVAEAGNLIKTGQPKSTIGMSNLRSSQDVKTLDGSELDDFVNHSRSFAKESFENRDDAGRRRSTDNTGESSDSL